jgi:hypothetical protein
VPFRRDQSNANLDNLQDLLVSHQEQRSRHSTRRQVSCSKSCSRTADLAHSSQWTLRCTLSLDPCSGDGRGLRPSPHSETFCIARRLMARLLHHMWMEVPHYFPLTLYQALGQTPLLLCIIITNMREWRTTGKALCGYKDVVDLGWNRLSGFDSLAPLAYFISIVILCVFERITGSRESNSVWGVWRAQDVSGHAQWRPSSDTARAEHCLAVIARYHAVCRPCKGIELP